MVRPMMLSFAVRQAVLALVLLGLVLAPVGAATPAAAVPATMAAMETGMPCCPEKQPMMPDCAKACPAAILCVSSFVTGIAGVAPAFGLTPTMGDRLPRAGDRALASLSTAPPARPPRP